MKFKNWMEEKKYGFTFYSSDSFYLGNFENGADDFYATKQSLIGYILEYLTTECKIDREECLSINPNFGESILWETIDEYYERLMEKVKELEK